MEVDFRKLFPAMAGLALMFGAAYGQEVLNRNGGISTAGGAHVLQTNVQIFLNTNATSLQGT